MVQIKVRVVDVYVFRRNTTGLKFLLMKRSPGKIYEGLWQSVAGKIESGEKAYQAAVRELKEETGLIPKRIFATDHVSQFYEAKFDTLNIVPVFGIEVEDKEVVLSEEHSAYTWENLEDAVEMLSWSGQKKGIMIVSEMASGEDPRMKWSEIHPAEE